ncbi:MAG: ATP-dependent DNA helicase [Acidimicrobiia bacterium]
MTPDMVEGFSVDLVGRDLTHDAVLIVENQLEATDHVHLGQVLTYAAGTDAGRATPARVPIARKWDREPFPGLISERRYTTTEILAIEQRIVDRAQAGIEAGRWTLDDERVDATLTSHAHLTDGQRAMVRQFATSGNVIDIGVGAAGTGKTTVMRLIADLANETGTTVVGTALAARAAAGFETATDIPSCTITRFLWETGASGGLPSGSIVVVDEAGMVGTRQLAEISDLVERAEGKLILIGDHRQLAEIDAGGLFSALAARLPAVELTENVRQEREWERTALAELRQGSVSRALAMYDRRGLINLAASPDHTLTQAVDAWNKDVREVGEPAEVLLIADRNDTVHRLNRRARIVAAQAGLLTGPSVTAGDRDFQAGDRVVCLKNRTRLGVLNGDLATVTAVDTDQRTITLHLDRTEHPVTIPNWYLDEGNLDWGYALTGHKAQGATARRAHTVAGTGVDREWIYVTMSRGREANTVYLTAPELQDDEDCIHLTHQHQDRLTALITALGRTASEPAAVDSGRGPSLLSDQQLSQRKAELRSQLRKAALEGLSGAVAHDLEDIAVEYVDLSRESEARHRDRVAAVSFEPPHWIADNLGERPADPNRRDHWDAVVDRSVRYWTDHGLSGGADKLPGPLPCATPEERCDDWLAVERTLCREQSHLGRRESRDRQLGRGPASR